MTFVEFLWKWAYIWSVTLLVLEGAALFTYGLHRLVEYVRKELSL